MKFKFSHKLALIGASLIILSMISITPIIIKKEKEKIHLQIEKETTIEGKWISAQIKSYFQKFSRDLILLKQAPPIKGIIRSSRNHGIDPLDNSTTQNWKKRLGKIFKSYLISHPYYTRISYIQYNKNKDNLVSTHKLDDSVFQVENKHISKADQLILNTIEKKSDIIHFEEDKKSNQKKFTLNGIIPIKDKNQNQFGFLQIKSNFLHQLKEVEKYLKEQNKKAYITSNEGEIIWQTNFTQISSNSSESIKNHSKKIITKNYKIYFGNKKKFLTLTHQTDESRIQKELDEIYRELIIIFCFLITIIPFILIQCSSYLLKPLKKIQKFTNTFLLTKQIKTELLDYPHSDDFYELGKNLKKMHEELGEKVFKLTQLKSSLDGFAIVAQTDAKGKITYVNQKFVEISKFSREELLGVDHKIINSGTHPKKFFKEMWGTILSGGVWRGDIQNKTKQGEYYWVDTQISSIRDMKGKIKGFIAIRVEITGAKKLQLTLKDALAKAEKADEIKTKFIANVSHELRTPLHGILGLANLLQGPINEDSQIKYVGGIKFSGEKLLTLVNELLDVSSINAEEFKLNESQINLKDFLARIEADFSILANEKGIDLIFKLEENFPLYIRGDALRLEQIITNLLGNAIKFTDFGSVKFELEVSYPEIDRCTLFIRISDTGIGVPSEMQGEIFKSFSRVERKDSNIYEGTGLGLKITKELVEKMGGEIQCDSVLGQGSSFSFHLSFKIDKKKNPLPPKTVSQSNPSFIKNDWIKILVAEDNEIGQFVIQGLFKNLELDLTIVSNGNEVMDCLDKDFYHLILMDIQMPEKNGYQTTKEILEKYPDPMKRPIIIALTANAYDFDLKKCKSLGMYDFLTKPLEEKFLIQSILDTELYWYKKGHPLNKKVS